MQSEDDALVEALRAYGVRYLSGSTGQVTESLLEPQDLIRGLAQSPDPLVRDALAALFLVHPELAPVAEHVAGTLPPGSRAALIDAYAGAVYLQTLWRTRLRRYLGDQPSLPPLWIPELALPEPGDHFGKLGLLALEARRRGRATLPSRSAYELVAKHLFGQLLTERAAAHPAA